MEKFYGVYRIFVDSFCVAFLETGWDVDFKFFRIYMVNIYGDLEAASVFNNRIILTLI